MEGDMASCSPTNHRIKPKKPLDIWSTREKLCLASAVFKIGDQNWVSVSRTIKPYADPSRPPDWFHQRNCRFQYYDMMDQLEQPKRKRGAEKSDTEAPSLQIMRKMTIERSEQLKKEIIEMQQSFKHLKSELEAIKAGHWDDRIKDVWEEILEEMKRNEKQVKLEVKSEDVEDDLKGSDFFSLEPIPTDIDDSTQDSVDEIYGLPITNEDSSHVAKSQTICLAPIAPEVIPSTEITPKLPIASHLLSSLLKSDVKSATGLQKLKNEQEQVQLQTQLSSIQDTLKLELPLQPSAVKSPSIVSDVVVLDKKSEETLSFDLVTPSDENVISKSTEVSAEYEDPNSCQTDENSFVPIKEETVKSNIEIEDVTNFDQGKANTGEELLSNTVICVNNVEAEKDEITTKTIEPFVSETELLETSVKEESPSPTSSICSRVSETGSRRGRSRGRPRSNKTPQLLIKKNPMEEDKKEDGGGSDVDSDEDIRSDDPLTAQLTSINTVSVLSESFPNSPASLSICSDTEEEKSLKQWKKSIMLVWRAAATHKYANVFMNPVTDEIAPGYHSVVHRPMDLSTIKKNIENGVLRTTVEFQRDMMLMFTNAVMYNSFNHNVYKMAKEMYDDVMLHIEQYVNTQLMIQTTDAKNLRQSRRPDTSDKEEDTKKRRLSVDHLESIKIKKRKTRLDESTL
ncbi:hypothetical protein Btru_059648 [Bulinus truncatus]|nr:hypothetical protein Btru_059648 [Bulinus truncatus]